MIKKGDNISFLVIDSLKNIVSFNSDPSGNIKLLFLKEPKIGQKIVEIIPQKIAASVSSLIDSCLDGNSFMADEHIVSQIVKSTVKIRMTFLPIHINVKLTYVVCILLPDISQDQVLFPDDYSIFTSHNLRAPISNILGLSNLKNYSKLNSDDGLKIKGILKNIHEQAEKLNEIIIILNSLINSPGEINTQSDMNEKSSANHIVLVDDDPIVNMMHKMILSKYRKNTRVTDFENPQKALDYIYQHKPDLIFLDINMPEINGWDFLQKLEDYPFKTNVVVISSSIDANERVKAYTHKCVKYFISKPLTYEKLKNCLT